MYYYKEKSVFDEALDRIRFVFDECDDIIVSMSGGKDSAVLFELAMIVAKEKNRLPLKVFWLDQEAEWNATVDYMRNIMHRKDVKPYWFQIAFDFTNSLSHDNNFLRVWDEKEKDKYVHQKDELSIKENPSPFNRFHDLVENLPSYCTDSNTKHCGVLVGMRIDESISRRMTIGFGETQYKGVTWCRKMIKNTRVFWPIYDFTNDDIWTAISKNKWDYNRVYDYQYQWGVAKQQMRVSALIHETAWHSIEMLQEFERETYNRFVQRIHGVSSFSHYFDMGDVMVKELPFAFKDWKEYRDYLLVNMVQQKYWDLFRNRWKNQNTEEWYKVHVKEIIVNDIDGTINKNSSNSIKLKERAKNGHYKNKDLNEFKKYIGEKK